ncbi:MAG TPA: sulfite reductase flavoprotein subunit alpha [Stenotrophomonas sp.]|jgi:sulfite reductase (NADPH) flavoprotein alpha-component
MKGRSAMGQVLVMLLLVAAALALLRLHPAPWWPGAALGWQWRAGAASLALYAALCGAIAWGARDRPVRPARASTSASPHASQTLVVWASQTGFAHELAARSVEALAGAGVSARALPLDRVDAATLQQAERVLIIASTTGEGDPPDHATGFIRHLLPSVHALPHLRYGVLALGDRSYARFCAFGRQLDEWLSHRGAHALFDRVEVDNADPGALRHWQYLLAQLGDGNTNTDWERPAYGRWRLAARERSNPGCHAPACRLSLQPTEDQHLVWQAGDIAEIGPCHPAARVQAWLDAHGADGNEIASGATLREWISRSQWPSTTDHTARADLDTWVANLQPLPHREYSIASTPAEGFLGLLVRSQRNADGKPGLGSGWLCDHAEVGGEIALRIRSNPGFHAPDPATPLILIGNGTGVAGLRAHLRARIEAGARRNWLLFGERHGVHDAHYGQDLKAWQADGWLPRLDVVYSRDGGTHRYVQDALLMAAPLLRRWVEDGASIYVCGSLQGMAPAVDAVIEETLGSAMREALLASGRYRRDVY